MAGTKHAHRLDKKQWQRVRARFVSGDKISAIASDYKIHVNAIYSQARRNGWKRGEVAERAADKALAEIENKLKDEHSQLLGVYSEEAKKRVADSYKIFDRLRYVLSHSANQKTLEANEAIAKAAAEWEQLKKEEAVRASVTGAAPKEVVMPVAKIPDIGTLPYQMARMIKSLQVLDDLERRLLGLDGSLSPDSAASAPFASFMDEGEEAHNKYSEGYAEWESKEFS